MTKWRIEAWVGELWLPSGIGRNITNAGNHAEYLWLSFSEACDLVKQAKHKNRLWVRRLVSETGDIIMADIL